MCLNGLQNVERKKWAQCSTSNLPLAAHARRNSAWPSSSRSTIICSHPECAPV